MADEITKIEVLDTMEAIRKRPSMYVGDVRLPMAATWTLQEALCMPIADGFDGTATTCTIELFPNGRAIVSDDGEGWPVEIAPELSAKYGRNISRAELYMTALFACREAKDPKRQGLCNHGIVMVNALSSSCELSIYRNGSKWVQNYVRGVPKFPLANVGAINARRTGTKLDFTLDAEIFEHREFDFDALVAYCTEAGGIAFDISLMRHTVIPKRVP